MTIVPIYADVCIHIGNIIIIIIIMCTQHQLMISNVWKRTYLYYETRAPFIPQAARTPPGHPTVAVVRSGFGTTRPLGGIYGDDLKGSSQCRIRACTIQYVGIREYIYIYILYIICKYWPRVFMPKECACHSVLDTYEGIFMYTNNLVYIIYAYVGAAAECRRNCVHSCAQYPQSKSDCENVLNVRNSYKT